MRHYHYGDEIRGPMCGPGWTKYELALRRAYVTKRDVREALDYEREQIRLMGYRAGPAGQIQRDQIARLEEALAGGQP